MRRICRSACRTPAQVRGTVVTGSRSESAPNPAPAPSLPPERVCWLCADFTSAMGAGSHAAVRAGSTHAPARRQRAGPSSPVRACAGTPRASTHPGSWSRPIVRWSPAIPVPRPGAEHSADSVLCMPDACPGPMLTHICAPADGPRAPHGCGADPDDGPPWPPVSTLYRVGLSLETALTAWPDPGGRDAKVSP